jgi:hypothetical protein
MPTYTTAEVNTWFQTIDGLPSTTTAIPSNLSAAYVAALNATPPTATVPEIQANLENFPFNASPPPTNVSTDLFYRTSVADFVLTEFQLAWGAVPTSGATSQYDAWVARIIADPSLWSGGGMTLALIGTPEFATLFGTNNPDQLATVGIINQLCANCGITPGAGALANVGLPIWQVVQNFAESSKVAASLDSFIANFQNLLLLGQTPSGSILTLPNSTGDTFTLTPNADTFSTSATGAVFNAFPAVSIAGLISNTLNAGDNLKDTAGDGALNFTAETSVAGNQPYAVGVTLNGISTLNYIGAFSTVAALGGFQGSVTGLTVVNDTGSTGGLQLGGIGQGLVTPLTTVNISGYAPIGGTTAFGTPAMFRGIISAAAGTSPTPLAVTITGPVGTSAPSFAGAPSGAAVLAVATDGSPGSAASPNAAYSAWDLTLNSTAFLLLEQGNVAGTASVGGVTTLTLSGAGNAFIGQDFAGDWQKLTTIDAAAETGTVVITGASAGVFHNAFGSTADPTWLLGSGAGLLNEGVTGKFALATFDLGTGTNVLDVSSASPTELAALTTTPAATVATDNVIIVGDAVATTTSTATFAHIAGFATLGVTGAGGTIDMANLPTSITDILYFTEAGGPVTISSATNGLTVDFHGNNESGGAFGLTVNGPTTGAATLNLDFGNAVLALQDFTGDVTTTGYSTVNITAVGDVLVPTAPDIAAGISLVSNAGASLTVNIAGAQAFDTGFVTDAALTPPGPTNATDVINVTDTSTVALGITNFGTVSAAASAGLTVTDSWHNSTITGSATGPNFLAGGDGGGLAGTGNTITGGSDTDSIITGIGANTINLAATHVADTVTIGSAFFGAITGPGDLANEGGWGQPFLATPTFISGPTVPPPPSLFLSAPNAGTSASETVINNFSATGLLGTADTLNIQYALWNNTNSANAFGETDFGLQTIGLTGNVGAGLIVPEMVTSGVVATNPLGDLIELTGPTSTFSSAAQLAVALQTGTFNLRTAPLGPAVVNADAHLLVAYSDGKNIHIADVDLYNQLKGTTESLHDNVYASDMVEVVGVNSFTNLNNHLGSFVAQV